MTVLVGLLAVPLGLYVWELLLEPSRGPLQPQLDAIERLRTWSMEILAAFWIFWVGASIGSFLNVVVYRTPRGISFVWRPSHCPYCAIPIQARDNIPILGWLLLGGRCRACRLPISPRYPRVELATAVWLLALYCVELAPGGTNLPIREPNLYSGALEILVDPQWDLIGLYAYHALLICSLIAWALIARDGFRVPRGCLITALVVGLGAPLLWPALHPVPWLLTPPASWTSLPGLEWLNSRLAGPLVGLLVGGCLGWLLDRLPGRRLGRLAVRGGLSSPASDQAAAGLALAGLFLGWQAAISVAVLTAAVALLHAGRGRLVGAAARPWWLAHLALGTTAQLFFWRALSDWTWWPGPDTPVAAMAVAMAIALALNLAARACPVCSNEVVSRK